MGYISRTEVDIAVLQQRFPQVVACLQKSGLTLSGDHKGGNVTGRFPGKYKFDGTHLQITVETPAGFEAMVKAPLREAQALLRA